MARATASGKTHTYEYKEKEPMMKRLTFPWLFLVGLFLQAAVALAAIGQELPVIDGRQSVAAVNNRPITLEEFNRALLGSHKEARSPGNVTTGSAKTAGSIDYSNLLQRLITIRLILLEADNMGLQDLEETRKALNKYSQEMLIEMLLEAHAEKIEAEVAEIKKYYEQMVREWKIRSVQFDKKKDALRIQKEIENGAEFGDAVRQAVADGIAEIDDQGRFVNADELLPRIANLLSGMDVAETSPVMQTGKNTFVLFTLEDVRLPEQIDPKAWKEAENKALRVAKIESVKDYYQKLKNKYVTINQKLFDDLDFEADETDFEALAQDHRALATIQGEKPVTVAEFTEALQNKFYHGVTLARKGNRLNAAKTETLEALLQKKVLRKEALARKVDQSEEFHRRVQGYRDRFLFGLFVEKVVAPGITLKEEELQTYYENHLDEFSSPKMVRIRSLAFYRENDALTALEKLTRGTDFEWMASNADGRVTGNADGLVAFDGQLLTLRSLPEGVRKTISGAKDGEFRMWLDPSGFHHVLYITKMISPGPRDFEEVRQEIAEKVFQEKLRSALDEWADQLSRHYPVEIYLERTDRIPLTRTHRR